MTPPNDAARPVRWIVDNCLFYDEESANAFSESLLGSPTCNPTVFPVYTAADYDALRAEVGRLQQDAAQIATDNAMNRLRAEAAEAKVAELRSAASMLRDEVVITGLHGDDAHDEFCPTCLAIRDLDAALNEGGE